jgi:hypothetical protein
MKSSRDMKKVLTSIISIIIAGSLITGCSSNQESVSTPKSLAEYEWTFVSWTPISPATGKFWFYVKNIGDGPGVPQCTIQMRDSTYLYHGLDIVWVTSPLPAGEIWAVSTPMVIKNEGSLYVDTHEISCKEKI